MKVTDKPKQESTELKLVDCKTLAARYGVSEKFVRAKTREGLFPVIRLSRRCCRWPVDSCDRIIAEHRINAVSES